jgi:hypothetical protein
MTPKADEWDSLNSTKSWAHVIPGNTPRVLAAISDRTVVEFAMLCDEDFAGSTDRVRRNPTSVMVQ